MAEVRDAAGLQTAGQRSPPAAPPTGTLLRIHRVAQQSVGAVFQRYLLANPEYAVEEPEQGCITLAAWRTESTP